MIMAKPSDVMTLAYSPRARIQFVLADVADAARTLEQSHLCGPTAGLVLAEALTGVALLGADLTRPQETVTLRMRVSGPAQGVLVEMAQDGSLRGYPSRKVINELDDREEMDSSDAFGDHAEVQIIRSVPGHILAHASLETRPASVRHAVEKYFEQSLQRAVAAQIVAVAYGGRLEMARGLLALGLPDADRAGFERLAVLFEDDTVAQELESCGALGELGETLGFSDLQFEASRPLRFACRCSRDRVLDMLVALSIPELADMAKQDKPTSIYCHMCGKGYDVPVEDLVTMLAKRKKG
ncbi:MAG: Hsp33 family molecular chaperone HslO [Kiritimatiellia bacterium]